MTTSDYKWQGCSQNLKAVTQNFMEVFKVDDVTANYVIQKKTTSLKKRKTTDNHIVII